MQEQTGLLSSVTSAFGDVAKFVWANIILDGVRSAVDAVKEFASSTITSAMESQSALADLQAVVTSTGGAAGYTVQQLADMASGLQNVTRFSDETIQRGEGMLLTFTNIGHDVFPLATTAMLDMAQKMGTDVQNAAIQLGKALNDPVNGLTALKRVGVEFDDTQVEMIKQMVASGDTMGAQKVILDELAKEFGGVAVAAGQTFAGQVDIAKNHIDDFKELIGGPVIFILGQLLDWFNKDILGSPFIQTLSTFLRDLNTDLQNGVPLWDAFIAEITKLSGTSGFLGTVAGFIKNIIDAFNLFPGDTVGGIANVLYYLGDTLANLTGIGSINDFFSAIGDALINIQPGLANFGDFFTQFAADTGPNFSGLFHDIVDLLFYLGSQIIPFLVDQFIKISAWFVEHGPEIAATVNTLITFFRDDLIPAVKTLWQFLEPILNGLVNVGLDIGSLLLSSSDWDSVKTALLNILNDIGQALYDALSGVWDKMFGPGALDKLNNLEAYITYKIREIGLNIAGIAIGAYEWGRDTWQGFIDGMNSIELNITNWVRDHIVQPVKDFLGIASPSTLFFSFAQDVIRGLIGGFWDLVSWATSEIKKVVAAILEPFKPILDALHIDTSFLDVGSLSGSTSTGTIGGRSTAGTPPPPGSTTTSSGTTYIFNDVVNVGSWQELCDYLNCTTGGSVGGSGGSVAYKR